MIFSQDTFLPNEPSNPWNRAVPHKPMSHRDMWNAVLRHEGTPLEKSFAEFSPDPRLTAGRFVNNNSIRIPSPGKRIVGPAIKKLPAIGTLLGIADTANDIQQNVKQYGGWKNWLIGKYAPEL